MNLTLNEKLRFQKQAGIINESQYKKLLKENEDEDEQAFSSYMYSIARETGITNVQYCSDEEWDELKDAVKKGKSEFLKENPDISRLDFFLLYRMWVNSVNSIR